MTTQELYGEALRTRALAKAAEKLAADANRAALDARAKADAARDAFFFSQVAPTFPQEGTS